MGHGFAPDGLDQALCPCGRGFSYGDCCGQFHHGRVKADTAEMLSFGGQVKREYMEGRGALQDQVYVRALAMDFFISLLNRIDCIVQHR